MLAALALSCLAAVAQVPRDGAPAKPATGTAMISGIVLTDDADKKPVRRARVSISDAERRSAATVITGDDGRFTFTHVAAGRYTVMAAKPAWVYAQYGALRPGRPGTPITIANGQRVDTLVLRLSRGAVITGTITDE